MKMVRCITDKPWIKMGQVCLFLGEIENMPEHGVYCYNEKVHYGYHIEDFTDLEDE